MKMESHHDIAQNIRVKTTSINLRVKIQIALLLNANIRTLTCRLPPTLKILMFISIRFECADICKLALNKAHLKPTVVLLEKERIGLIKIDLWHNM